MSNLIPGGSTGRSTKVPAIPDVRTGNAEFDRFALAVKEYIEVREGVRGNPYDRVATLRDIAPAADTTTTAPSAATTSSSATAKSVSTAITGEISRLRSEIARSERAMRDIINSFVNGAGAQLTAQAVQALGSAGKYTKTDLANDLATGAATIIAGAASGQAVMQLAPDGSYVLFKHKDANVNGLGAGYSGTVRTAVGITAAGFIAGYNRPADGAFQPSVVIDSATGDVTILGTLKANSVIEVGAFLGSQTVSSVLNDVSAAYSNASSAYSLAASKLDAQSTYILGTDFALKTSGYDGGNGIIITNTGILGKKAGATTFAIDNTGAATFAGDIVTSGRLQMSGTGFIYGGSFLQNTVAYINATQTIYGLAIDAGGLFQNGLYVQATGGNAVVGASSNAGIGVYGYHSGSGAAVQGIAGGSGPAVSCSGPFRWGAYTYSQPDGGTDKYLRNDGTWAPVSGITSGVSSFNSRTGAVTLTASDLTNTSPSASYFLSGGGWIPVNVVSKLNGATGDVTNAFYASVSFPGVGFSVSGSGTNSVTYTIYQTSDRSLKRDIRPNDLGMEFIRQLQPVSYEYADEEMFSFRQRVYGLIANDVLDVLGQESSLAYTTNAGPLEGKLAADYSSYVAPIITALQQLDARLTQLEQANAA